MNLIPNIIGSMLGNMNSGNVGNAQANSTATGNIASNGNNKGAEFALGLLSTLRGNANPFQALRMMANSNPRIKQGFDYVEQNGGDLKTAFYKLAQEKGLNPEDILNMIK